MHYFVCVCFFVDDAKIADLINAIGAGLHAIVDVVLRARSNAVANWGRIIKDGVVVSKSVVSFANDISIWVGVAVHHVLDADSRKSAVKEPSLNHTAKVVDETIQSVAFKAPICLVWFELYSEILIVRNEEVLPVEE